MGSGRRSRLLAPLALALAVSIGCHARGVGADRTNPPTVNDQAVIGVATQEADGTIVLQLRASSASGAVGDAMLRYAPGDRNYAAIARHVGPIPKGGSVPVRRFDR